MTIMIQNNWTQIGVGEDGSPIHACGVYEGDQVLGRIVDLNNGFYRADFVNGEGNPQEIVMPDYPSAIMRVVEEAKIRRRMMN